MRKPFVGAPLSGPFVHPFFRVTTLRRHGGQLWRESLRAQTSLRVLVIAPQFPSLNQPWMDTYLEHLLVAGIEPSIYSQSSHNDYCAKVDELGLKQRILPLSLAAKAIIKTSIKSFISLSCIERLREAWMAAFSLGGGGRCFVNNLVSGLFFSQARIPEIHLIHSHDEVLAYRFLMLAKLRGIPFVLTFHGLPPSGVGQLDSGKRSILYKNLNLVFVNTLFAKEQVCALGCEPSKVKILPQGLPLAEFVFSPLPPSGLGLKVLTVGRFHRDKGQGYALLAMRRLIQKGINIEWSFVGVGPDLERLKRLVRLLKLEHHVRFLVALPQDELKRLYHRSHLFVLPSVASPGGHVETQGVVLQEAQASGCIPIASYVGGIPECLHDGIDALLVKQKSSREIARAIEFFYHSPHVWPSFQLSGRKNVEQHYSAEHIGRQMAETLITIASAPR